MTGRELRKKLSGFDDFWLDMPVTREILVENEQWPENPYSQFGEFEGITSYVFEGHPSLLLY